MGSDRTRFNNNTALLNIRNVFKKRHTLATALQWRSLLDANPHLGTEDIANQVELSAIQVRQILRLNKLHPTIQKVVLETPHRISKRKFSHKALRDLVTMPHEKQLSHFRGKWPNEDLDIIEQ